MKTIYTSLPIYDRISKQCFERGKHGGYNKPVPIACPRHRLPSFQWNAESDNMGNVTKIELISTDGVATDITTYFVSLPSATVIGTDTYYHYDGNTLNYLMTAGVYYLKITMANSYILYSDWFKVDCVYENIITGWSNNDYNTFTTNGTAVTSAVENPALAVSAYSSDTLSFIKGETIRVIFYITITSGEHPEFYIVNPGVAVMSNIHTCTDGLNDFTLTATGTGNYRFMWNQNGIDVADWSCTEVICFREYSDKYLIINFYNECDLYNIYYSGGFDQTVWFESETMENTYPQDEQGANDGEGRFIRYFARQTKKYIARTKEMPDFMVDVFNRMKMHDNIELIDLVGNVNDVYNLEVDIEWLWDDKYYAKIDLTFDYNEAFVIGGCCNNIS